MENEAQLKIDGYLHQLRERLARLPGSEVREIVEEIRTHILERASEGGSITGAGVDTTLTALGDPKDLAGEYLTGSLLAQAGLSRSPFRLLRSLFRWASFSIVGFFALVGSLCGYFLGAAFFICALMKPIHPHTVGLWVLPSDEGDYNLSLHLGFKNAPIAGHELLGWWMIPIGLLTGCALLIVTTGLAIWCARKYRASHACRRAGSHKLTMEMHS